MRSIIKVITVIFGSFFCLLSFSSPCVLIESAMPSELSPLLKHLHKKKSLSFHGIRVYKGMLSKHTVYLASTGIGKVNAAVVTASLINELKPKFIIWTGVAGSIVPKYTIGDVVIGKSVLATDRFLHGRGFNMDNVNPINHLMTPEVFQGSPFLVNLVGKMIRNSEQKFHVALGRIATTSDYPPVLENLTSARQEKADAIEMEGSAFMQTCWLYNTACVLIRGISDNTFLLFSKYKKLRKVDSQKYRKAIAVQHANQITLQLVSKI